MIGRDDFIEIIRKELTSGAATSTELINVILKAIRDKFPSAIQQDVDGATYIVVKTDNVGLAKSTDISATQPRDITDRVARILGQITDGTNVIAPADFGSAKLNLKSEIYLGVFDLTVAADETVFASSGSELCAKDLTIDGKLINNGAFFITGSLTINGELDNYGAINIGV